MLGIKEVILKFIKFDDTNNGGILVNNANWLDGIKYIDFLRSFGEVLQDDQLKASQRIEMPFLN